MVNPRSALTAQSPDYRSSIVLYDSEDQDQDPSQGESAAPTLSFPPAKLCRRDIPFSNAYPATPKSKRQNSGPGPAAWVVGSGTSLEGVCLGKVYTE